MKAMDASAILQFWFDEITPAQWWKVDPDFDHLIQQRFSDIHARANRCELFTWRQQPRGRLAEIIVLDQFSRNSFRGMPQAFTSDPLALALAQEAVAAGVDDALNAEERNFLYMPYMHSEARAIHEIAELLFKVRATTNAYEFELKHKAIIDGFGRYPHRNVILQRESTVDELEFLKQSGSEF